MERQIGGKNVKDSASIGALNIQAAGTREEFRVPTEKPGIRIKTSSELPGLRFAILQNLDNLTTMRDAVIEYLVKVMTLVSVEATSTITSYNIVIAETGTPVTPASWLKINTAASESVYKDGALQAEYDPSLLMLLFAPIRLAKATVSEYRNTLVRKISERYRTARPQENPGALPATLYAVSWAKDPIFERIAAAYDAFWSCFPNHSKQGFQL